MSMWDCLFLGNTVLKKGNRCAKFPPILVPVNLFMRHFQSQTPSHMCVLPYLLFQRFQIGF